MAPVALSRRAFLQGLLASTALAPALVPVASRVVIPSLESVGTVSSTWGTGIWGACPFEAGHLYSEPL